MAEIPLSTKNMQSAMVHVPSLVCSLLMISSLVSAGRSLPQGRCGASRLAGGGNIMTLRLIRVNRGKHDGRDGVGRRPRPPFLTLTLGSKITDEFFDQRQKQKRRAGGPPPH